VGDDALPSGPPISEGGAGAEDGADGADGSVATLSIAVFVAAVGRPCTVAGTSGKPARWRGGDVCGAELVTLEPESMPGSRPGDTARAAAPPPALPLAVGTETDVWSKEGGTNRSGSLGNSGASSASICSVEAVYDWASLIIRLAASALSLVYRVLAVFTSVAEGPPSWLPTSVAFAA
jgi:hypothetical protein